MTTEAIKMNDVVFSHVAEQSIELDYILPDYCCDVFKILKAQMRPSILSERISGNKLMIDGVADIKVVYLGEDGQKISRVEQKQTFTKNIELKEEYQDAVVNVRAKCDYFHCRAQNSRRLEMKGVVTLSISIFCPKTVEAVCNCEGLQLHKKKIEVCEKELFASREFTVREELQIGGGKPAISEVLDYSASGIVLDYKLLANKVICKGEVALHTLYIGDDPLVPEVIEHSVPVSQILDCEGMDEDFVCKVCLEVVKYDIDLQIEENGKCIGFTAEIGLRAYCEAVKNHSVEIVDDCYSTAYEVDCKSEPYHMERFCHSLQETNLVRQPVKFGQGVGLIYDLCCSVTNVNYKTEEKQLTVLCNLQVGMLGSDMENMPVYLEQSIPCEIPVKLGFEANEVKLLPDIRVASVAYTIVSSDEIEIRAELQVSGIVYQVIPVSLMTQIVFREDAVKQRNDSAALRIYFADQGESVWAIAKRYNTSVSAILEQNEIDQEYLTERGMILIPIVD